MHHCSTFLKSSITMSSGRMFLTTKGFPNTNGCRRCKSGRSASLPVPWSWYSLRVSPQAYPKSPSINAQAGSNPKSINSSFPSMIGRVEEECEDPCTTFHTCVASTGRLQLAHPITRFPRPPKASEACDASV